MAGRIVLVMAAIVLAACSTASPLPSLPADMAPEGARSRPIDGSILVEEASDSGLATVLDDAGFEAGREWSWTDRQGDVWRTVVRVLRFGSPDGAATYLNWIDGNVGALIGPAEAVASPSIAYEHHPSDCCPNKDGPQALAATADGDLVWTVTLAGPAADASRAIGTLPEPQHD